MEFFEFTGGDARDYFHLGRIEPGDRRQFDDAPDTHWKRVPPSRVRVMDKEAAEEADGDTSSSVGPDAE